MNPVARSHRCVQLGNHLDHTLVWRLTPRLLEEGWATLAVIHDDELSREAGGAFSVENVEAAYPRFAAWGQRARARGERIAVILRGNTVPPRLVRVAAWRW
jgi:hypothetical protein